MHIKKKDTVLVLSGKDKGKRGEVLKIYPDKARALVAKLNLVTRHTRPTTGQPGGLLKKEAPMHVSKLALVCPKCGQPTRPRRDRLQSGERVRVCRKCNEVLV